MPGTAVVQAGNYELLIDTGFAQDAFTLNSATKGVLNNAQYVLDGTTNFADVTTDVTAVNIKRGRRDVGDQFSAGTMTFTLNDEFSIYNPRSGQNVNVNNQPALAPMRAVRFTRYDSLNNPELLFVGYIVNYNYSFQLGGLNTVSAFCNDEFYLLAQTVLAELDVTAELSGARIATVLALPEVAYTEPTNLDTGTVTLGDDPAYTVAAGTNVLAYLSQINDTAEFGRIFMARDGVFNFDNRLGNTFAGGSVVQFSDDGLTPYDTLGITFEADQVVNRATVTALNANTSTATDAASIAEYLIQATSITNSLLQQQSEIDTAATYLINGQPVARFTDLGTTFASLTTGERDAVAIIDIGNTIQISKKYVLVSGTTFDEQVLTVEGVEHAIDFGSGHQATFFTAPTTIVNQLILDDPVFGLLDSNNALG